MTRRMWAAAVSSAFMLTGSPAEAAKCTIVTTAVAFGSYNVFSAAPVDSTGSVRFNCNGGASNVHITVSRGQSTTYAQRTLRRASESLGYNLFLDAGRSTIWGDGTGGSQSYFGGNPPNNQDVTVTMYGRVPAGQDISAGAYSDSVSVTINF
ncbi:MAG: spore coat protein U domain-containing protein [Acidimicrobiia bacterium]|nr:spore coat protein U domain-containing protein [Acidimicrobiia bacterium]